MNKEEEKGLIKQQLIAIFEMVIKELKKIDKEVNSAV